MMKQLIFLFVLLLNFSVLFAQKNREKFVSAKKKCKVFYIDTLTNRNVAEIYHVDTNIPGGKQIGDTLAGEHGKYKFYYHNSGGYLYLSMQNIGNRDTANLKGNYPKRMIHDSYVPEPVKRQFAEIVREFLTQEERAVYKQMEWCGRSDNAVSLVVHCRVKRGKIRELAFAFNSLKLEDVAESARIDPLWGIAYFQKDNMLKNIPVDRYYAIERALIDRLDFTGEEWMKGGQYFRVLIKSFWM